MKNVIIGTFMIVAISVFIGHMTASASAAETNPYLPSEMSFMPNIPLPTGEIFAGSAGDGRYLYVSSFTDKLYVFDLQNINAVQLVSTVTIASARKVFYYKNMLFVSDTGKNLHIYDCSDPSNLVKKSTTLLLGEVSAMSFSGNYAYIIAPYVAGYASRVRFYIMDISDPASPVQKTSLYLAGRGGNGNNLYLASYRNLVFIRAMQSDTAGTITTFDVSNVGSPAVVNVKDVTMSVTDQMICYNNYYILTEQDDIMINFRVYDTTNPSNPVLINSFNPTANTAVRGCKNIDGTLFVYRHLVIPPNTNLVSTFAYDRTSNTFSTGMEIEDTEAWGATEFVLFKEPLARSETAEKPAETSAGENAPVMVYVVFGYNGSSSSGQSSGSSSGSSKLTQRAVCITKPANPGKTLQGTVTDASSGDPVNGATVTVSTGTETKTASTSSDGKYVITGAGTETAWDLAIAKEGYHTTRKSGVETKEKEPVTENLRILRKIAGAGAVMGRVVDAYGKPCAGVKIDVQDANGRAAQDVNGIYLFDITTDANGNFTVPGIPPGAFQLVVWNADKIYLSRSDVFPVYECNAAITEITVDKEHMASLTGKVTDASTGKAVDGATVTVNNGTDSKTVTTGTDGKYSITDLLPDKAWEMLISKEGYHTTKKSGVETAEKETRTENERLVPKISGKGAVIGRVVDGTGKPLQGVKIDISKIVQTSGGVYAPQFMASVVTDSDGKFSFSGVDPGMVSVFVNGMEKGYYNTTCPDREVLECNSLVVDVILAKEDDPLKGAVTGKVVDAATGKAIPNAKVQVSDGQTTTSVQTGTSGEYTITGLSPDKAWTQIISGEGYHTATKTGVEVKKEELTIEDIRLVPKISGKGAVIGRVVDGTGKPLQGVKIDISKIVQTSGGVYAPQFMASVVTDSDGKFSFSGVDPGMVSVFVNGMEKGYYNTTCPDREVLECNSLVVDVILAKEDDPLKGAVTGKVVDAATGKAIPNAKVQVSDGQTTTSVQTGTSGEYTITGLSPDKAWTQIISGEGYHTATKTGVEVKKEELTIEDIRLVPKISGKGAVIGRVVDGTGKPLQGVKIDISKIVQTSGGVYAPQFMASVVTDSDGKFSFSGVDPGMVSVFVNGMEKGYYNTTCPDREVLECNSLVVDVILAKEDDPLKGAVTGKVVDAATGKAIPNAKVQVSDGQTTTSVQTGTSGEYTITGLSPDKAWTQIISGEGYHTATKTGVEVKKEELTIEDIRLVPKISGKGAVIGRVVDGTGKPLQGVKIDISKIVQTSGGVYAPQFMASVVTDSDGKFSFSGVDPGMVSVFVNGMEKGYYNTTCPDREVLECNSLVVDVILAKEDDPLKGAVTGKVVDAATGKAIPNATVSATQNSSSKSSDPAMKPGAAFATTVTDKNGNYFFSNLPVDATYNLTVSGEGIYTSVLGNIAVEKGLAYVTPLYSSVTTDVKTCAVGGRVVYEPKNRAIAGAKIVITPGDVSVISDSEGLWSFNGLQPNTYTIKVTAAGAIDAIPNPVTVGAGGMAFLTVNLSIADSTVSVKDEQASLPLGFSLREAFPNPFNPTTTIAFTLPSVEQTTLAVYDITGRMVRTLVSGQMTAGSHAARWDGRDEQGRPVSSGVYYSRLISGSNAATVKMLLLK